MKFIQISPKFYEAVTEQAWGVQWMIYYYWKDLPFLSGGPPTPTRFTLPATREKMSLNAMIGEKERNYLFKSYTDLE